MRRATAVLFVLAAAACHRSPSVTSCEDHLGGVWESADGAARWHILDGGERLEAYPLVRELPAMPPGTQAAPSRLELHRTGREVAGSVVRRWNQGAHICVVRAPARIRGCSGDRLTLVVGDTGSPAWPACDAPEKPQTAQLLRRAWP